MKSILKLIPLIIAIILGAVGADFLKQSKLEGSSAESSETSSKAKIDAKHGEKDSHGKKADKGKDKKDKKDKKGKKDKKDKGHGDKSAGPSYLKFKRQFVVPVMTDQKVGGLVLMNFSLELNDDAPTGVFTKEPKLRDAYMRVLLEMSSEGAFDGDLVSPDTYNQLRRNLLGASHRVIDEGVEDILILDVVKQDQ
jgi:hypothetical protein